MSESNANCCLITYGQPMDDYSIIEKPFDKQSFVSHHSMDMKFIFVDEK